MLKEDKVKKALSSTLSESDMKHLKVNDNLIQIVPKGPRFSMDKIPLDDPDFEENDEWKTTLSAVEYFLKKIIQERDEKGDTDVTEKKNTKKQRKRRSKKPEALTLPPPDEEQVVPQTDKEKPTAVIENKEETKSEPAEKKPTKTRKKRISNKNVPDPVEAEIDRSVVTTEKKESTSKKKKRSKKNNNNQEEPPKIEEPTVVVEEEEEEEKEEKKTKRKPKRKFLNKPIENRKAHILESDVLDYSELEDAVVSTPFLSKDLPLFAPDHNKKVSSRISNKNKPTEKNKHAEIPPPKSLTTVNKPKKRRLKLSPTETLLKSLRADLSLDNANVTQVIEKLDELLLNTKNKKYFDEIDMIVSSKSAKRLFPAYIKPDLIPYLVEQKILLQGYIRISRKNAKEAYVVVDESDTDAFIYGAVNRNRAMDGDRVVIIPLDSEKVWEKKLADGLNKKKASTVKKEEASKEEEEEQVMEEDELNYEDIMDEQVIIVENEKEEEEEEEEEPEVISPPALCGRVVYIYPSKEKREYPGTVILNRSGKILDQGLDNLPSVVWFKPVNKRVPLIMLKSASLIPFFEKKRLNPAEKNMLKVKMQYWSPNHATPLGTLCGYIGKEDTLPTQCKSILLDSNISDDAFNNKIINSIQESPRDKSSKRRKDFRKKRIFTIDPATAKDLDDALHVEKISDTEFEVGVHIADVSHFVNINSPLDTSAFHRATSVYLCDRVIPMFPFQLSEEKCSLNPNEDRLTFSVIWRVDNEGNVKSTEFTESTIRSCAKLAYDDAQAVIETDKLPKDLVLEKGVDREGIEQDIKYLAMLAKKIRQRRFDTGSLSISSITLSFQLDVETGKPIGVSVYQQKEANKVIEEFMLLANMSVAHKLHQTYPEEALLRQHGPPKEKALNKFLKVAESLGYPLDGSSAGALQASLNSIKSEHVKQVLEILAAKPMQRAKYFCAGTPKVAKFHHYALNIPLYTHFTSPIRRFADVIVHRQLKAALSKKGSSGYSREKVQEIAHQCNDKKESAKNVEDDTKRVYLAYYLDMLEKREEKPIICTGIITSLDKEAIEVLVPEYGIEKRIFMDSLPLTRFVFNGKNFSLNAYWKSGVDVNLNWAEEKKMIPLEKLPQGGELYKDKHINLSPELTAEESIDKKTMMQRFSVLDEIKVRLQTDVERSPPATFVFPVNPFV